MGRARANKRVGDGRPRISGGTGLRVIALSILLIVVVTLLVVFSSEVMSGLDDAWSTLVDTLGWGLIIIAVAVVALVVWAIWRRQIADFMRRGNRWLNSIANSLSLRYWNRWLGVIAILFAVFCIISIFDFGGSFGDAVVGDSVARGALIVTGLILLGIVLIIPRRSRLLVSRAAPGVAALYRRYPLHRYLWQAICRPVSYFKEHPVQRLKKPKIVIGTAPAVIEHSVERVREPRRLRKKEPVPVAVEERVEVMDAVEPVETIGEAAGRWQLPSLALLDRELDTEPSPVDTERGARIIEEALASYGVEAKVIQANVGPAVTQYGVEPGWDRKFKEVKEKDRDGTVRVRLQETSKTRVKVERIASLANDLALALEAPSIKIEAPIPGKAMVGIEVPNPIAASVSLRNIMETSPFQKIRGKTKLPLALGKGMSGESIVADLAKMPHLLIAGATNSGKSVCMKSIIATFLMHATPEEVRFLMVDLKRVELVSFNNVPHLLVPVVVDHDKAVSTLKWLVREMDHRYERLAAVGARDIESYNKNPRVDKPLSYLVLIVDELAELMMTAPDEVERMICRLAQLARATGIHLIVATQRPSVDVVTGLIKANFPARVSFAVASQIDSRTILDAVGAEKLLGRGDMLFLPPDAPKPRRLQGSFISEPEIERLVSYWITQHPLEAGVQLVPDLDEADSEQTREDPLLKKAMALVAGHSHISTSFLQRRLGIGYPRAAKIIDMLEDQGIVAAGEPGKSREVLMRPELTEDDAA
ncbi:MAG: DNA translocase FtsK [Chloroflexota bacterium]|nr:DNA translocase FtsK [Chloroflexota bacterium]